MVATPRIQSGAKAVDIDFPNLPDVLRDLERVRTGVTDRVFRAGLRVILNTIGSEMKKQLDSTVEIAAKGVKSKIKGRGSRLQAKVGFGVGIKRRDVSKYVNSNRPKDRPGVGISAFNAHWWIQGTEDRKKKRNTGASTGRMPSKQPGLATRAAVAAMPRAEQKAIAVMNKRLRSEQTKASKG